METDTNSLLKVLAVLIGLSLFANVVSLTNPTLSNSCGVLNVSACFASPVTPNFADTSGIIKTILLAPIWLVAYGFDVFVLFSAVLFAGFSLNLGAINVIIDASTSLFLFLLLVLSIPILTEVGNVFVRLIQAVLDFIGNFIEGLGASDATALGYGSAEYLSEIVVLASVIGGGLIVGLLI